MTKFVSKENLETVAGAIETKLDSKITDPGNGAKGQVLVKTDDSTEWQTPQIVTKEEIENMLSASYGKYVDLGLPSGLLWATCNLGAETETDYGLYFQWGDTKGYKTSCEESESDGNKDAHYFGWSKYKFGTESNLTKYCTGSHYGVVDNKIVLEPGDDAAITMLGGDWRMPTAEEFQELIDNTDPGDDTYENPYAEDTGWIDNYKGTGVNGLLRKSKTNGNTIFFPAAAGFHAIDDLNPTDGSDKAGSIGEYWSSSLDNPISEGNSPIPNNSQSLAFANILLFITSERRCDGFPIRAVTTTPLSNEKTSRFATKQSVDELKDEVNERFEELENGKEDKLPSGQTGQVLSKTSNGYEFIDLPLGNIYHLLHQSSILILAPDQRPTFRVIEEGLEIKFPTFTTNRDVWLIPGHDEYPKVMPENLISGKTFVLEPYGENGRADCLLLAGIDKPDQEFEEYRSIDIHTSWANGSATGGTYNAVIAFNVDNKIVAGWLKPYYDLAMGVDSSDIDEIEQQLANIRQNISKLTSGKLDKTEAQNVYQQKLSTGSGINITGNTISVDIDRKPFVVVSELPEDEFDPDKIYLVPNGDGAEQNQYTEYLYVNGKWEIIGTYQMGGTIGGSNQIPKALGNIVSTGFQYYNDSTDEVTVTADNSFNLDNPESTIISRGKINFNGSNFTMQVDMDDMDTDDGWYIYCLRYFAVSATTGIIAVNCAIYEQNM